MLEKLIYVLETFIGKNWRTTISGDIAVLAAAIYFNPSLVDFLPESPKRYIIGFSGLVTVVSGMTFAHLSYDSKNINKDVSKGEN